MSQEACEASFKKVVDAIVKQKEKLEKLIEENDKIEEQLLQDFDVLFQKSLTKLQDMKPVANIVAPVQAMILREV